MSFLRNVSFDDAHPVRLLLPTRWRRRISMGVAIAVLAVPPVRAAYVDWTLERATVATQRVYEWVLEPALANIDEIARSPNGIAQTKNGRGKGKATQDVAPPPGGDRGSAARP